ncbi:MAG: 2-oxo acid dehydrogenase subunit E2 [Clostridia bacterium]|nr:2-oxo acid dehydrogenase subunit E2 [Clostridia bacterium]
MFGRRADGRVLKKIDPIIALTPYLMPMRCDAQVFLNYRLDYEKMARYIVEQGANGNKLTFMELIIAAFVRTVSEMPEVNRFIMNKRLYARTQLTVSFALLLDTGNPDDIEENTVKCYFDPRDTIFDVAARVREMIEQNRRQEADNSTMKVAKLLLNPILANTIVALARFLDRYGIMPKYILDASPFHTSMFITNMGSIGMPAVNHHIYNFGTTSLFWSMGNVIRETQVGADGKAVRKRWLPIGVTADERICAGATYSKMVTRMVHYLQNPSLLETPPETVAFEENNAYSLPLVKEKKKKKQDQAVSA